MVPFARTCLHRTAWHQVATRARCGTEGTLNCQQRSDMFDWSSLDSADWAVVVTAAGVVVAAVSFIWSQVHLVLERRRERMMRVMKEIGDLLCSPQPKPDEVLTLTSSSALSQAYLGLSGKAATAALELIENLGPECVNRHGDQNIDQWRRERFDEAARAMWKSAHPFKRFFRRADARVHLWSYNRAGSVEAVRRVNPELAKRAEKVFAARGTGGDAAVNPGKRSPFDGPGK